jgi:hypothetical protein
MYPFNVFVASSVQMFHTIQNFARFNDGKNTLHAAKTKVTTAIAMSANNSSGHSLPTSYDTRLLDAFLVISPSFKRFKDIIMVVLKPPNAPCIKVNTDGSLVNSHAACGGLFRDHSGAFLGAFSSNLGDMSIF